MVAEFHEATDTPWYIVPSLPRFDRTQLRANLMLEETFELQQAIFAGNYELIADALADCLYVLIGTAGEHGLADKLPAIFAEVHRSNMSKMGADGKAIKRADGKIMKGPNFTLPNLKPIIDATIS